MARVNMTVHDGALRCALSEREWLPLTAGLRHLRLPDVFVPPADQVAAWCEAAGVEAGDPKILDSEDELTRRALRLKAAAAAEVDLQVSVCGEGAMVLAWTNGVAASSLARAVVVPADDSPQLVDGVTVSAFPVARLAQEVLSHLPSGGSTPDGVRAAAIAPDLARELVVALRSGDDAAATAVAHRAGFPAAPPLLASLATGLIGEASLVVRGQRGHVRLRLVLCEAGWVEIHATADGRLAHTPYDTDGLLELLRRELAAQLSAAA
jgi:hypothetical protein